MLSIGLNQEGIYRVNGNSKLIEKLRVTFDQNGDADLTNVDIYSIGGLLKLFLVRKKQSFLSTIAMVHTK